MCDYLICGECGSPRVFWRCDNHNENISKYKCKDCGNLIIIKKDTGGMFTKEEMEKLKAEQEKERKRKARQRTIKGVKTKQKRRKEPPKHYTINKFGSYVLKKSVDGKLVYGGTYKDKETAEKIVKKLNDCGWDKTQLQRIRKEVLG